MSKKDVLDGFSTCPFCPEEVVVKRMKDGHIAIACKRCDYVILFNARTDIAKRRWNKRMSMLHGTLSGYNTGCRCQECREASKKYVSKSNQRQREKQYLWRLGEVEKLKANPDDPRHGKTGYSYGCRCDKCKEEGRVSRTRWYREKRKKD